MYISYFRRIYVFKRKYIIPLWSTFLLFLLTSSLLSQKTLRYGSANLVSVCWPWSAQFVIFSNCYLDPSANFLDCTRCQIPPGSISSQTHAFFFSNSVITYIECKLCDVMSVDVQVECLIMCFWHVFKTNLHCNVNGPLLFGWNKKILLHT